MSFPQVKTHRRRIGVLVSELVDDYQSAIIEGACQAARARGIDIFCFVGGEFDSPALGESMRNHVFSFVGKAGLDAVLVIVGGIANRCTTDSLSAYCAAFGNIPVCTIAGKLSGIPSVSVNNRSGVHDTVTHLIRIHGCKRIAFIKGPEQNEEAIDRFQAYREALAEQPLEFDPKLVAPGDFSAEAGDRAIALLFGERRLDVGSVDAIVAADDATAFGAIQALEKRRIRIPSQIAVVGFDDVEEARFVAPPLTTVRQPLREQGAAGVRLLLKQLQGEPAEDVCLSTTTILRRSCGCFSGELGANAQANGNVSSARGAFETELAQRRDLLVAALSHAAQGLFAATPGWEILLMKSFAEQLRTQSERFTRALRNMVESLLSGGADVTAVHEIVTIFRRQILDCLDDRTLRDRAEEIFQQARLSTSAAVEQAQAKRRARTERIARVLSATSRELIAASSVDDLCEVAGRRLPGLGVASCYVSVFRGGSDPDGTARTLFAYDPEVSPQILRGGEPFPSHMLACPQMRSVNRSRSFVILSVHSGHERLGLMAVSLDGTPSYVSETFADMVGASIDRLRTLRRSADVFD
jgi:sigma-B regulation protein RsbU (phosphoserine phosphatase)